MSGAKGGTQGWSKLNNKVVPKKKKKTNVVR